MVFGLFIYALHLFKYDYRLCHIHAYECDVLNVRYVCFQRRRRRRRIELHVLQYANVNALWASMRLFMSISIYQFRIRDLALAFGLLASFGLTRLRLSALPFCRL